MIEFVCDTCAAVKQPEDVWIVGLAIEAVGVVSARREVNIQSAWTREAAVHPFAVHFCSLQCKDEYTARLFAPETPVKEVMKEVVVERTPPAQVVVERVVPGAKKIVTKRRAVRRSKSN